MLDKDLIILSELNDVSKQVKDEQIDLAVREQIPQGEVEAIFRKSIVTLFKKISELHPELTYLEEYSELMKLNSNIEAIKANVKGTISYLGGSDV